MAPLESESSRSSRLVLGTAQLGMDYGVANRLGRPDETQASDLIGAALTQGIEDFDTAPAYGESETVLGRVFAALDVQDRVRVVSKGSCVEADGETLTTRVGASLKRLAVPRLSAWLLHDENEIAAWTSAVAAQAAAMRAAGRVGSFGVSAYHPENALRAIEEHGFTSLQFPASPLDRRFLRAPVASRLAKAGVRLFVRSVYLQGLCLMAPAQVPAHIFRGREAVQTLHDFCARRGLERDHFCLHYVLRRTAEARARLVIGVESEVQLARNAAVLSTLPPDAAYLDEWDALWPDDVEDLVLPYRWNARR